MLRWTSKCLSFVLFLLMLLFPDVRPWLTRPLSSAKRRKEDAAAAPPSTGKGGDITRTFPARSPL